MLWTTAPATHSSQRSARWCDWSVPQQFLRGKTVALVGSGPGVLHNAPGFVDGHDVVVRVNNWKLNERAGRRTDIFYSFFGRSIRKTQAECQASGVQLCMAKCPDEQFMDSAWHAARNKYNGIDFRYIYDERAPWWFCPVHVPTLEHFLGHFELLGRHVPTTGFSALLDVLACEPASVYMTGFDFFVSGLHNVNERWRPGNPADPIGHRPMREAVWVRDNLARLPLILDAKAQAVVRSAQ